MSGEQIRDEGNNGAKEQQVFGGKGLFLVDGDEVLPRLSMYEASHG